VKCAAIGSKYSRFDGASSRQNGRRSERSRKPSLVRDECCIAVEPEETLSEEHELPAVRRRLLGLFR
jgi:hypothetical protein